MFVLLAALLFVPAAYSQIFTFSVIDASGNGTTIQSGATITFPPTPVGGTSTITVNMANLGTDPDVMNAVFVDGPGFQLSGLPFPGTPLPPNSVLTFTVTFKPTAAGNYTAPLKINFSDENNVFNLVASTLGPTFSYSMQQNSTTSALSPGQAIAIGDTPVGQTNGVFIQITNTGNALGQIDSIAVQGAGFTLANPPFTPLKLAVGASVVFGVFYTPTQSGPVVGRLKIGDDNFDLTANSIGASLYYFYTSAGAAVQVQNQGTVVLSPAAMGSSSSTLFFISNQGTASATVTSIGIGGINGTAFTLSGLPSLPLTLTAGASASFSINFAPNTVGVTSATLVVDAQTFNLSGSGSGPAVLPTYSFSGASGVQSPRNQPAISLALSSPYALPITGTLTLAFLSDVFVDDPAVQFSTGSRVVNFTIPANSTTAVFSNGSNTIRLSTGSVAGTITVTPSFATTTGINLTPSSPLALTMTVPQLAPSLLSVQIDSKTPTGFNVTFTGMATGRNLTQIGFHFTLAPAANLTIPDYTSNVEQSFNNWYQSSGSQAFGSLFTVSVPFNLAGQVAGFTNLVDAIQSVSVTLTNHQGASSVVAASLQ